MDRAAEKAVLARSLSHGEPPRWHAEISTAILAIAVFVAFMAGREVGILAVKDEPCAGLHADQYAWISYASDGYDVTLDTHGNVWRKSAWEKRISSGDVRRLADALARGCFLEWQPPSAPSDGGPTRTITFSTNNRIVRNGVMPLCGGRINVAQIEQAIRNIAGQAPD